MELQAQICEKCGREFPSSQALGSHMFWKHEYPEWRQKREDARERGEPVVALKGIRGVPQRGMKEPWFKGKFSEVVRRGMQITYLVEE
jgi:hypothetical protein